MKKTICKNNIVFSLLSILSMASSALASKEFSAVQKEALEAHNALENEANALREKVQKVVNELKASRKIHDDIKETGKSDVSKEEERMHQEALEIQDLSRKKIRGISQELKTEHAEELRAIKKGHQEVLAENHKAILLLKNIISEFEQGIKELENSVLEKVNSLKDSTLYVTNEKLKKENEELKQVIENLNKTLETREANRK
jgi:hypothetical protein